MWQYLWYISIKRCHPIFPRLSLATGDYTALRDQYVTQFLAGHGTFRAKLHIVKLVESIDYEYENYSYCLSKLKLSSGNGS